MAVDALVFEVHNVLFGIFSTDVQQVLRAVAIDQIPNAPPSVEGVINVRGNAVPVLNLRYLTQLPLKELEVDDHLIVVRLAQRVVAVRVDRAVDLVRLDRNQLADNPGSEVPLAGKIANTSYGFIHFIDWNNLLTPEDALTLTTI